MDRWIRLHHSFPFGLQLESSCPHPLGSRTVSVGEWAGHTQEERKGGGGGVEAATLLCLAVGGRGSVRAGCDTPSSCLSGALGELQSPC